MQDKNMEPLVHEKEKKNAINIKLFLLLHDLLVNWSW